jgi:hypothetical protein
MSNKGMLITSVLTIALGLCWLLDVVGMLPGVDWIWTGLLAATGLLILVVGGLNRVSIVAGPWLLIASAFSVLRQTGRVSLEHEVPMLVIALGVLMLVATLSPLPLPKWMEEPGKTDAPGQD